jgi:hypothetical protein
MQESTLELARVIVAEDDRAMNDPNQAGWRDALDLMIDVPIGLLFLLVPFALVLLSYVGARAAEAERPEEPDELAEIWTWPSSPADD